MARHISVICILFVHSSASLFVSGSPEDAPAASSELRPMQGAVLRYVSRLYGDPQPFAACATDLSEAPKPLIVDLIPGTLGHLEGAARDCERICKIAKDHGRACVALRPCGRGNGSVYQGYGEVDVYEAVGALRKLVAIDPERITVTGASMGGAATWYHASHYPDFWAAAAPFCGYCDYKLWEKPGGTTFHRQPWEECSWISRDAAYRVENLRHVPVRITHGEWDRAVGGGVPVEHSRQMDRKLSALGYPHHYVEVPRTGHGCRLPGLWEETIIWLLDQERTPDPDRVSLTVHTLRHNRIRWVAVEQQMVYGNPATAQATVNAARDRLEARTENVRRLALGPVPRASAATLVLDRSTLERTDLTSLRRFVRGPDGSWAPDGEGIPTGEKRPGLSGPFGDIFFEPIAIVYGASGSDVESELNRLMARNAASFFREENGGVHRGGIRGDNSVEIPIASDKDALAVLDSAAPGAGPRGAISKDLLERANLFLIGNAASNAVIARLSGSLPVRFSGDELELCGETYRGEHLAFYAVLPHPDGRRYVALLSGAEPDAITWGSHVGLQLLPDYLIFHRGEIVQWGFWGNSWRR